MEIDAIFEVSKYEKTDDGWTAYGKLYVTDRDTNESIIVDAYSGGRGRATDGVSLPIPMGKFEILEPTNIGYRLEAKDSNKGNDIIEGTNPKQENIRLHGPGSGFSYGCIGVSTQEEWNKVKTILLSTNTEDSMVDRWKGLRSIVIKKYGDMCVRQSKEIIYRQLYASPEYRTKYNHQTMDNK